jgi:hypothetical protein
MFDMVDSFVFADLPEKVIGFTHTLPFLAEAIALGGSRQDRGDGVVIDGGES